MDFLKLNKPDIAIISQCINLANHINQFDNIKHPVFGFDEFRSTGKLPILYYAVEGNEITGFIGISLVDETEIEICGFVHLKYRNLKVASHLLEMVFDDYEDFEIKIPLATDNTLGKHFLNSYNAKYESTECIMQLEKDDYNFTGNGIKISTFPEKQFITFKAFVNNVEVGTASVYNEDTFIIHNVEIYDKYRGQKYGQALLHTLLTYQFKNCNKATLHVTKENTPAFNLYTKLGFSISRQLEYYSI